MLLPAVVVVHLAAVALLVDAVRRLPSRGGPKRTELVLSASLFPPALLRAPQELIREEIGAIEPTVIRRAVLSAGTFLDSARVELARLEAGTAGALGETRRAAFLRLASGAGLSPEQLTAARTSPDPNAASWCPWCLGDYRPGFTVCPSCGVDTVPYATR